MRATSRLTSKARTTVPLTVRRKLGHKPGDVLVYDIEGDAVRLRRQPPLDAEYLRAVQATLSEWSSPEDAEAYDDL